MFTAGEALGFHMEILDIGGGFPGVDADGMTFEKVTDFLQTLSQLISSVNVRGCLASLFIFLVLVYYFNEVSGISFFSFFFFFF